MSKKRKTTISCPYCRSRIQIEVFSSYNFQEENCDIKPIINDSWVKHVCPRCRESFTFLGTTVFHDMDKKSMLFFFPKGSGSNDAHLSIIRSAQIPHDYSILIVEDSYASFKEQILILESGLDYLAVDLYKHKIRNSKGIDDDCESHVVFNDDLYPKGIIFFEKNKEAIFEVFDLNQYKLSLETAKGAVLAENYIESDSTSKLIEGHD